MRLLPILTAVWLLAPVALRADDVTPWQKRADQERAWEEEGLALIPHQPNYIFPVTYNRSPHRTSSTDAEHFESKFQLSIKVLLLNNLFGTDVHTYFAYTQLSLWQIYNREQSAPFRDTNHQPEFFFSWDPAESIGEVNIRRVDVGVVHESNGVSFPDSRSWNRAFAALHFDWDHFAFGVKPWVRVFDSNSRDNRDIIRFMGHGELSFSYFLRNHVLSLLVRNNLRKDNKGALKVNYSFPLTRNLTGLAEYFTGYGESLIDYNRPNERYSIGIALGNWG